MKRFTRQQITAWILLLLLMLAYAAILSALSILRYATFKATAFDLGNMDQVFWNTIHGRLFQFTNRSIDYYGPPTRLAVHFEPIILPLSLLYVFGADPRILLVFQSVALAAGALPVFLLTRYYIPRWPLIAPVMALAYCFSPALIGVNLFDFHPVSLAAPALLYAVLALTYRRNGWFLVACVIAAATKEDVPLAVAALGILVIWKYKQPRLGLIVLIGGCLWSLLAFRVIIPHFFPGQQSNNFWYRYESLGNTPGEAIVNLLLHPWLLFGTFITLDRFYYILGLLRSTGFLALLAPEWLIPALPDLAVNLLSTDPTSYSGSYQYNAAIIPFITIAAIHGTRSLIALWHRWRGEPVVDNVALVRHASNQRRRPVIPAGAWRLPFSPRFSLIAASGAGFARAQLMSITAMPGSGLVHRLEQQAARSWQRLSEQLIPLARTIALPRLHRIVIAWIVAMTLLNLVLMATTLSALMPDHLPGSREQHIEQLLARIPPDASVAAGSNLNPHVSERRGLAVFPYITYEMPDGTNATVDYIIVDLDAIFPQDRAATINELNYLTQSGQFIVLARAEGVELLARRGITDGNSV